VSCGACRWCRAGRTNLCATYYTLGLSVDGGLADQVLAPASTCLRVPDACSDRAAVLAQPLAIAFHSLARSGARPDDRIVVVGAGAIGAFIVAAASSRGFRELIAVDVAEDRLETARTMGAHETLFADAALGRLEADVVIEATGVAAGLASALAAVRRGGRLLVVGFHDEPRALDLRRLNLDEIELVTTSAHICSADLPAALAMLTSNQLADRAIERVIPLEAVVDDGLAAMADGRVRGKVVVDVAAAG